MNQYCEPPLEKFKPDILIILLYDLLRQVGDILRKDQSAFYQTHSIYGFCI